VQVALGGEDIFTTTVIGVDDDEDYLLLECGRDHQLKNRVLDLQKLLCSTSLEKIKIQFACRPAELVPVLPISCAAAARATGIQLSSTNAVTNSTIVRP
jgi:hypothetical protein